MIVLIQRPFRGMPDDELADEITYAREAIATTRDVKVRKKMQGKLAELLGEQAIRNCEGLPF